MKSAGYPVCLTTTSTNFSSISAEPAVGEVVTGAALTTSSTGCGIASTAATTGIATTAAAPPVIFVI